MIATPEQIQKLTVAERIDLALALWESLPPDGEGSTADVSMPLTEAQRTLLEQRRAELDAELAGGDADGVSWQTARDEIRRGRS